MLIHYHNEIAGNIELVLKYKDYNVTAKVSDDVELALILAVNPSVLVIGSKGENDTIQIMHALRNIIDLNQVIVCQAWEKFDNCIREGFEPSYPKYWFYSDPEHPAFDVQDLWDMIEKILE